jgi:hypothetical protein
MTYWRFPDPKSYTVGPPERPNTLRLTPSRLNLTGPTGNYAGPEGQTFVGRRQQETLFTFDVDMQFSPGKKETEAEAGVSVFLTQNHHLDLGVVMLPANTTTHNQADIGPGAGGLVPHFRFRGTSYVEVPADVVVPVPQEWRGEAIRLQIRANETHYDFSATSLGSRGRTKRIIKVSNEPVSWGFTGKSSAFTSGLDIDRSPKYRFGVLMRDMVNNEQVSLSAFMPRVTASTQGRGRRLISRDGFILLRAKY